MPERLDAFCAVYAQSLAQAVERYPEQYPWAARGVPVSVVVERMRAAILRDSCSYTGAGMRGACRQLGIRVTRTAIRAWLQLSVGQGD